MGKKKFNPECFTEMNHFSGVLPSQHNEVGCHNVSQQRRRILSEMKALVRDLHSIPKCEEWDTSLTTNDTRGPFKFGEFQQRNGKPWDPHRVKSNELVGSQLTPACICLKRNGLQDECKMQECRGRDWCLTEPWPQCPPFTKEPKKYVEPNPLENCPNVKDGKMVPGTGKMACYGPQQFFVGNNGCCYSLEQISNPCCPQMQGCYSMQPC